ncbi:NADPH-dependent oxidoreductase [Streptomyces sp. WAC05374]|uniref:NADPH-dependent FMN reductase n=1 Tax=Streptomyces sp. WAC05374 TaxID=2487420 RepID=UPI000F88F9D6|nr:NAD(P)H-dependent oxidoreductase [Streptomyces sp. WAC05374]RST07632.1 NADPH-dependent oxidoreductase [Streptomyces sp. WAC05374]TDF45251.1 NADPH-dependent oxidoreductase [Streptomyces sp. WAC05374]TDF55761.1 NADPH-dependent oxidoreductase [Streptomyces sp. WAC05374]TDF58899.1 NADPH-dependent oxidoreductase [Streptomyces sp. WAC05374]
MEITTTSPLTLAVIVASNREGRFGPVIADWFLAHATQHTDFATDVIDLGDPGNELPTALSYDPAPAVRDKLAGLSTRLAAADAFVVLTPEYNHSFPASIKNLIDWHYTEWQAKPVGFVSYGGLSGGLRAVEQLRQVFAEMHAVTVRDTVSFHNARGHFDDEGRHKDPTAPDAAAKTMLDQLAWWGHALRDAKAVRPYGG